MRADRSVKRNFLTHWGMNELHKGRSLEEVQSDIKKHMRLTLAEIKEMTKNQRIIMELTR